MAKVIDIHSNLPTASEVDVYIPSTCNEELFNEGFNWGMKSNKLTIFKRSYMEGFRSAKLYLKEVRRKRGILQLPTQGRMTTKLMD